MEVYTVTVQFRMKAEDKDHAERKATLCESDFSLWERQDVLEIFPTRIHHYETIPDEEGE